MLIFQTAVSKTVAEFNMGHEKALQLEIESGQKKLGLGASQKIAQTRDRKSVARSLLRCTEQSRYKRKADKKAKNADEKAKRKKEGPSYGPRIAQ